MTTQQQKELLGQFGRLFPRCAALPILPVPTQDGKGFRDVYDSDDVAGILGGTRFTLLMTSAWVKQVYSTGHRNWPLNHAEPAKQGAEVHCIAASDLERFLKAGN